MLIGIDLARSRDRTSIWFSPRYDGTTTDKICYAKRLGMSRTDIACSLGLDNAYVGVVVRRLVDRGELSRKHRVGRGKRD